MVCGLSSRVPPVQVTLSLCLVDGWHVTWMAPALFAVIVAAVVLSGIFAGYLAAT
jgi:hypothetical protein